ADGQPYRKGQASHVAIPHVLQLAYSERRDFAFPTALKHGVPCEDFMERVQTNPAAYPHQGIPPSRQKLNPKNE
ncbi:MAG: hypothetical protein SF029_05215, partial [bacterium]|nr:hypothetical protein [bacterium]